MVASVGPAAHQPRPSGHGVSTGPNHGRHVGGVGAPEARGFSSLGSQPTEGSWLIRAPGFFLRSGSGLSPGPPPPLPRVLLGTSRDGPGAPSVHTVWHWHQPGFHGPLMCDGEGWRVQEGDHSPSLPSQDLVSSALSEELGQKRWNHHGGRGAGGGVISRVLLPDPRV